MGPWGWPSGEAQGWSHIIAQLLQEPIVGVVILRPSYFVWLLICVKLGICDRQK